MNNYQRDTTHIWHAAIDGAGFNQLNEYKFVDGAWWVYSPITNWRLSCNDDQWFTDEILHGYLKPKEQDGQ